MKNKKFNFIASKSILICSITLIFIVVAIFLRTNILNNNVLSQKTNTTVKPMADKEKSLVKILTDNSLTENSSK